jgi:endonuclease YncB( thermonuclease family)
MRRIMDQCANGKDCFGRTLARVTINGQDIGEQMVAAGFCRTVGRQSPRLVPIARALKSVCAWASIE